MIPRIVYHKFFSPKKHSKDFVQDSEQNGSKRKLETITQYLADKGMDVDKVKSYLKI